MYSKTQLHAKVVRRNHFFQKTKMWTIGFIACSLIGSIICAVLANISFPGHQTGSHQPTHRQLLPKGNGSLNSFSGSTESSAIPGFFTQPTPPPVPIQQTSNGTVSGAS